MVKKEDVIDRLFRDYHEDCTATFHWLLIYDSVAVDCIKSYWNLVYVASMAFDFMWCFMPGHYIQAT